MSNVRFVKWEPKKATVFEKDLPAGTRYAWEVFEGGLEFLALADGTRLLTRNDGNIFVCGSPGVWRPGGQRDTSAVKILDWPASAGPRPDAERKATWDDIIDGAPSKDAMATWLASPGGTPLCARVRHLGRVVRGPHCFLGWLVID